MQGQDGVQTGRYRPEGIQIYSKRECYSKTQRINIDGETSVRRLTALGRISRSTETHNRPTLRDKKKGSNFSTEHWAIINLMGSLHADDQGQSLPSFVLLRPRPANGSLILARITQTEALAVAFLCFFLCSGTGAPRCQEISDQISRLDGVTIEMAEKKQRRPNPKPRKIESTTYPQFFPAERAKPANGFASN
ncbi:hypothetical protein H104_01921 [Trichophyton rubrum CBS 289.86]|nr:hypothetical protein H104_01921 [Trichophyton rubrum CBS 289.86]